MISEVNKNSSLFSFILIYFAINTFPKVENVNSLNWHKGKNFCSDLNLKRVSFAEQTDYNIRKEIKRWAVLPSIYLYITLRRTPTENQG